ncbi:MAG TPA: BatA domain-containing protein [Opitutaceae bacterium]
MNFLAPLFLIGGLAIAAPIIYHLIRRTTRERTKFSSLMFLMPSPPRLSKRHRLEHWLLLLLRCLALALLVLGFARPFLKQAPIVDPSAAEPKRVVVLVDRSASMRRAGAWDAAKARAEEVLRRAGPADQVALYAFDRQAQALMTFEDWNRAAPGERVAFATARLGALAPTWVGTHLGNALMTAAEALAEDEGKTTPGPRQVVLVSDLQAGSRLDALQAYEWPKGVELFVEAAKATNPTNAGVQLVAESVESSRAVDAPVRVRVTNSADAKRERFTLAWVRPGATPGAALENVGTPIDAYVPPGQSRVFSLPVPKGAGAAPERIVLRGDDEEFDNTAYVIPPVQQRSTLLWIGSDVAEDMKQPLFFLRRAFAETPRVAVNVVATAPTAPLRPEDVASANILFVSESVPDATAAALRKEIENGKTAVVVVRSTQIAPTLSALAGTPGQALAMSEGRVANYAMLADIDFQHPLFAPFADPRFSDFTKIHVWKYRKFDLAGLPGARAVAKYDSGDPAIAEVPVGKGRVFVLGSGWHPEDSQLAVSSKFVPLVWSLLELAGGGAAPIAQFAVGDTVPLAAFSRGASSVRTPDGQTVALDGKPGEFTGAMQPGIYETVGEADGRARRFAVNLDANESRTAPLGTDELDQLGVPVAKAASAETVVKADQTTQLQGVETENRQKLWRWFIVATLAILLVESMLAGWTTRRTAAQPSEVTS